MTNDHRQRVRRRPLRTLLGLLLLGLLTSVTVLFVPNWLTGSRTEDGSLLLRPECTVQTSEGEVGLDRDEAQLATTAVARLARGMEAPDTSGIDDSVLQRLADGPAEDAGPSLTCRGSAATDLQEQQLSATGLTPRAEQLRATMAEVFGDQSLGGFAPGGVGQGHGADSTHYDGRAIDIFSAR